MDQFLGTLVLPRLTIPPGQTYLEKLVKRHYFFNLAFFDAPNVHHSTDRNVYVTSPAARQAADAHEAAQKNACRACKLSLRQVYDTCLRSDAFSVVQARARLRPLTYVAR